MAKIFWFVILLACSVSFIDVAFLGCWYGGGFRRRCLPLHRSLSWPKLWSDPDPLGFHAYYALLLRKPRLLANAMSYLVRLLFCLLVRSEGSSLGVPGQLRKRAVLAKRGAALTDSFRMASGNWTGLMNLNPQTPKPLNPYTPNSLNPYIPKPLKKPLKPLKNPKNPKHPIPKGPG